MPWFPVVLSGAGPSVPPGRRIVRRDHPSATGTHSLMNRDAAPSDEITTAAEFEAALGRLLTAAVAHGVDPRGSWVYRNGDGAPDWETMVHELEKPDAE